MHVKGFNKDLTCRGKQYAINQTFEEDNVDLCHNGMHYCEAPHHAFTYYAPGTGRFCEVTGEEVSPQTEDDSKRACKRLIIGAEIDVFTICRIAVNGLFEWFGFAEKINKAKESPDQNAGNCGAANAGNKGAAIVQAEGKAATGKQGVAIAGTKSRVKGDMGAVLVLVTRDDDGEIIDFAAAQVDGETILADTWYELVDGQFVVWEDSANG